MTAGNLRLNLILIIILLFFFLPSKAEDSHQDINIIELPATFEEEKEDTDNFDISLENEILETKPDKKDGKVFVELKALDKITAKTSIIKIGIGKKEVFGELEIKVLKCVLSSKEDPPDTIAYLQIKDLSEKNKDQVFIFNGWTFASTPTLRSIDHPVYDLWLVGCENV